jgi:curli biogenesis system outer membrane secretion channel CsgG
MEVNTMLKKCTCILVILFLAFGIKAAYAYDPFAEEEKEDTVEEEATPPIPVEPVYQPYYGPKKRIAVTKFENKVRGVYGNWNLGEGFGEMLTTELMNTGRFIVVERQALQDVIGEQELGQAGLVKQESAAKVGELLGAQIIVRGVVSEFDIAESGGGGGIGIRGFRLGVKTSNARVAVDIRLIDSTTGQVLYSHNAAGHAEASGVGVGVARGQVDFHAEGFKKTPLGQATREAISDCVDFIISRMESVPFSAKVIKVTGDNVYINAGTNLNIKPGMVFKAYSVGEAIVDPDTNLVLGQEEKMIGLVEVKTVQDKFSIGYPKSGAAMLKKGDVLRLD